jgi:hypothetical protein
MAKSTPGASGSRARKTERQTTQRARRPSGARNRKKAKARTTTAHGVVSRVLNLATYGFWAVGSEPRNWLWAGGPGEAGRGPFGPVLNPSAGCRTGLPETFSTRAGVEEHRLTGT